MPLFVDPTEREEFRFNTIHKNPETGEPEEYTNVVTYRTMMDIETESKFQKNLLEMKLNISQNGNQEDANIVFTSDIGKKLAFMVWNVTNWSGRYFETKKGKPIPCNKSDIRRLHYPSNKFWIDPLCEKIALSNAGNQEKKVGNNT